MVARKDEGWIHTCKLYRFYELQQYDSCIVTLRNKLKCLFCVCCVMFHQVFSDRIIKNILKPIDLYNRPTTSYILVLKSTQMHF